MCTPYKYGFILYMKPVILISHYAVLKVYSRLWLDELLKSIFYMDFRDYVQTKKYGLP